MSAQVQFLAQSRGGKARARVLGSRRRSEIAKLAANSRWSSRRRRGLLTKLELRSLAKDIAAGSSEKAHVFLFGSYARGEAGPMSDVDLLVVEKKLPDWLEETVRLRRIIRAKKLRKSVDLIVTSEKEYKKWSSCYGSVQYVVATEGTRLV